MLFWSMYLIPTLCNVIALLVMLNVYQASAGVRTPQLTLGLHEALPVFLNRLREMTEVLFFLLPPCLRAPPQEDSLIKQSVLLELLHSWCSPQHPEQSSSAD